MPAKKRSKTASVRRKKKNSKTVALVLSSLLLLGFAFFAISKYSSKNYPSGEVKAYTIADSPGAIVKQAEIDYFLNNLSSNSVYQDTYNRIMSDAATALNATPKPPTDGIFNSDDPYYPGTETYNPDADRTDYINGLRDSNMVRNLALAYRFTGLDSYKA